MNQTEIWDQKKRRWGVGVRTDEKKLQANRNYSQKDGKKHQKKSQNLKEGRNKVKRNVWPQATEQEQKSRKLPTSGPIATG